MQMEAKPFELRPIQASHRIQATVIPYRKPNAEELQSPQFTNLTGIRFGKLTVIGICHEPKRRDKGCQWVCVCDCGLFTTHRSGPIRRMMYTDELIPKCPECNRLDQERRCQFREANGRYPNTEEEREMGIRY